MRHMGPADCEACPVNVSIALHWPLKTLAAQSLSGYGNPRLFSPTHPSPHPEATGVGSVDSREFLEQAPGAAESCAGRSWGVALGPQVMGARSLLRWPSALPLGKFSLLLPETCSLWLPQGSVVPTMEGST